MSHCENKNRQSFIFSNNLVCDISFPENQGDALLLEVQGEKRIIQGRAVIPVSSLHDNLVRLKYILLHYEDRIKYFIN